MAEEVVLAIANWASEAGYFGEIYLTAAEAGYIVAAIEIVAAIYTLRDLAERQSPSGHVPSLVEPA